MWIEIEFATRSNRLIYGDVEVEFLRPDPSEGIFENTLEIKDHKLKQLINDDLSLDVLENDEDWNEILDEIIDAYNTFYHNS